MNCSHALIATVAGAAAVTACSRFAAAPLAARGVDVELVTMGPEPWTAPTPASPPPSSDDGVRRLAVAASVNLVKDPETLLRAVAFVARDHDVRLDWVGVDTLGGVAQDLARTLGIADRVRFHGFMRNDGVRAVLGAADIYVQASRHEGQGVSVVEAALAGVPTAGTAVGVVADLAPAAAVAVPVADPRALGDALAALLADEALRRRVSGAARDWAQHHTADATAAGFERVYERVAGGFTRGA